MNCNSNHSLFLRSNGDLACWDDYGSLRVLQSFDPMLDYATLYLEGVYEKIRSALRSGQMPWPEHCARCMCLMPQALMDDGHYARVRLIETFQIEPSMGCQLACPGCVAPKERRTRVSRTPFGHMTLKSEVLEKIIVDLRHARVHINRFDFQGHGEPTLNKELWEMMHFASVLYPTSVISLCTHANLDFDAAMVHSGVNEVLFSIDGVDQASYAPYRIHGDFEQAWIFMRDFSLAAARERPKIDRVWKYVVFDHNDSTEALLHAQELALEAKITEMRFVRTQLGPMSSRIADESDIPRLSSGPKVTFVAYRVQEAQLSAAISDLSRALEQSQPERAEVAALFFRNMLIRLFRTASDVPESHLELIRQARPMIASLSPNERAQFDSVVTRLVDGTFPGNALS